VLSGDSRLSTATPRPTQVIQPFPTIAPPPSQPTSPPSPTPIQNAPSTTKVTVLAAGTPAFGVYPTLTITLPVNGTRQSIFKKEGVQGNPSSGQYETINFIYPNILDIQQLRFEFTNDASNSSKTEDRNLQIKSVTINGQTYDTLSPDTLSVGSWNSQTSCNPGFKKSNTLQCNGYFVFDL